MPEKICCIYWIQKGFRCGLTANRPLLGHSLCIYNDSRMRNSKAKCGAQVQHLRPPKSLGPN